MTLPSKIDASADPRHRVIRRGRWLIVDFAEPREVLSWAIVGGGRRRVSAVAWYEVDERELRPPVDPRRFLRQRMEEGGIAGAVGLLTSRNLDSYVDVQRTYGAWSARCIATVGLSNALRAGDPPGPDGRIGTIGTINLLCSVSGALTDEALVEALALAAEARTAAILDALLPSRMSGLPATGTGTDCVVVSAAPEGPAAEYAGKHTVVGHLIGTTVTEAIGHGVRVWKSERREKGSGDAR
ncbi:MAG: adenosylcobinamide amidohydrolase [Deltaproteobacteria bacterium]|nr:adenosylcobinamide amidohydrolase [Deltaproteobacteria bacterium]